MGLILFVVETIKYILAARIFRDKLNHHWIILAAGIFYTGLYFTKIVSSDNNAPIIMLVLNVMLFLMLEGTALNKIGLLLKIFFVIGCSDITVVTGIKILASNLSGDFLYILSDCFVNLCMGLILVCKNRHIVKIEWKNQKARQIFVYIAIFVMEVSMLLTLTGLQFVVESQTNQRFMLVAKILSIVSILSVFALVLFIFYMNHVNLKMKNYLDMEQLLRENQKSYYEAMLAKEEETKKFRHDITNHMICLNELLQNDRKVEAISYVGEVERKISAIQQYYYCVGNIIFDSIMNYYLPKLGQDVTIKVVGKCEEELEIKEFELCTIFSNLVKNAVEEIQRQSERQKKIGIDISSSLHGIKIEITNSIAIRNEKFLTVKDDYKNHGIGLKNIEDVVKQNKGIFQYKYKNSEFIATVILPKISKNA